MAMLMWQHGEEAIAKALVAAKLYKALAHEAADDDLETEVYEELKGYAKEFEALGKGLLTIQSIASSITLAFLPLLIWLPNIDLYFILIYLCIVSSAGYGLLLPAR